MKKPFQYAALALLTTLGAASVHACPQQPAELSVHQWLSENAVPLETMTTDASFASIFESVRVIGLGEATHGQRECFAFKRRLTMHLIQEHGFRLVAYEADATRAQGLNDYVHGRSDNLEAAMSGFGMMIWMVEENRSLLKDLRAWNQQASEADRVDIIGIDVQDAHEAAQRLHDLLEEPFPDLAQEALAVATDLVDARNAAYGRVMDGIQPAQVRLTALTSRLTQSWGELAARTSQSNADEAMRCARELARFPVDPTQPAMRDRGMAQSLLDALAQRPEGTKAVLWGHNGHITKGPMRWMGTTETACGGVLRASLGEEYYALGVSFGSGGFQALHRDEEGKWWFRRYAHGPAPADTVGHACLAADLSDSLIDFRTAPSDGPIRDWLNADSGMRSWGGHGVPDDPDAAVDQGYGLAWTIVSADYDGLLFLKQTTSAEPTKQERIWAE